MNYTELTFTVQPLQPGCDLLISELADRGFESFSETETGFAAYIPESLFSVEQLADLEKFRSEKLDFHYTVKHIPSQNWNEEWERNFSPVEIAGQLRIRAPFHAPDASFPSEIVIQPRQSFGTGHHATTRLMIQKLLTMAFPGRYILDMGCGTGVLAIFCAQHGAAGILGMDIDPGSVENAGENALLNGVNNINFETGTETEIGDRKFDLLLANINKNVLKNAMRTYAGSLRAGGEILLSGFFTTDVPELIAAAEAEGLHPVRVESEQEWALVHLAKKNRNLL
ncbi:MAG TPA: 50S ribosomal protein L11 methyltransferase [Bacteroidia bacterium]|nr:50S ribosomal protein L11 methyltransferase [Bacteroidia bacterium]